VTRGTVVCSQPAAAEAGVSTLRVGGNVFDAAVAAALMQAVMDPLNCGIGGFGVAQLREAGSSVPAHLGFHARAPLLARPDMFEVTGEMSLAPLAAGTWPVRDDLNQIGYLSVGVPGTVAGLAGIARRHCRLDWKQLDVPAILACREGWTVTAAQHAEWTREGPTSRLDARTRLAWTSYGALVYTADGAVQRSRERVVNPDNARTLERLAEAGPEDFYRGDIGGRSSPTSSGTGA